jgi:hypothetical protein
MSTLTLDLDLDIAVDLPGPGDAHGDAPRGRPTLDDLVVGAWEDLLAHHPVTCPICSAAMAPRYGSGPRPVGGRCSGCGSTLH